MDLALFWSLPLIVQTHALAAIAALGLGAVQFTAPKGTLPHRTLGYVWVGLMVTAAVTALFIREVNDGRFSWLHLFVPITLFGVVELSIRARRGLTNKHRASALWLFFAALMIPGAFTLMPGRAMHQVFFG